MSVIYGRESGRLHLSTLTDNTSHEIVKTEVSEAVQQPSSCSDLWYNKVIS